MEQIALITGASGGIGLEIAKLFAKDKINLLLIARSEAKLINLKQQLEKDYPIKVHYIAADLSVIDGLYVTQRYIDENALQVEHLVNNAGFGDYGPFVERSMEKYREMLGLNISTLVELTHYCSKEMIKRGHGRILNVSSTAGFQPVPYFAVYAASKAFVINFTEALHKEFEKTGVTTTVLSPGATQTGFIEKADMGEAKLYKSGVMSAEDVARVGYNAMKKGKLHVVAGFGNRIQAFFSSMLPSSQLRLTIAANVMKKASR
ncbi:SDR family NAD(P)-dependent oxidoreductase [Mucilaginibacter gossypii]|uniref:SDR family oxidoreductase n=1 Tax=Mucilaginibacter gossypii TaxID=551996 RepID=A0A1G8CRV8_9SPHI|nr:SDR family oxidoreductase [Mucilaginibacter gossypii]SDH48186.1 hypothetical protein SAMN05192573_11024 [Mucilaginibacter gossypii]